MTGSELSVISVVILVVGLLFGLIAGSLPPG